MSLDDMSNIKDKIFRSGRQTQRTMIIDDMSNIMEKAFMSRIHKHKE